MSVLGTAAVIKGLTALGQGVAGAVGASQQAEAEKERAAAMMDVATDIRERALARRKEFGLGPSFSDLRQVVLQDPTSDYLRQQEQRSLAGGVEAYQAGGARALLGGLGSLTQASMDRMAQIAQEEQLRKQRGLAVVGEAEQRVAREKLTDARADLGFGRAMTAEAQAARFGAEDLSRLGKQQAFQSGLESLGAIGLASQADKFKDTDMELFKMIFGGGDQQVNAEEGAVIRGKTPGEFSHEENPIDIMQDGQKIGEMTGGEGVVSPQDLGELEQLAGQGQSPLHKFVRRLIKKLERNG
jgi:hypothetical protein